ncbi:MAG: transcriptional regulator [Acidimicrobiaceae bacterium]|nr:transcriptional regulator [Acidimicrobiaceae bacterium]
MHVPPQFYVDDQEAWRIVEEVGAGTLVISTPEGLASVFVPVIVSTDHCTLLSHLARANPWWKTVGEGTEALGLFLAASAYVSPNFYPSRLENPDVVPTWNYVAVEIRGRVTVHHDAQWKLDQVRELTRHFERGYDPEWKVDDLEETYRDDQLRGIVGLEITVQAIEGKAKLSQNRPAIDHDSVRDHLAESSPRERNVAERM